MAIDRAGAGPRRTLSRVGVGLGTVFLVIMGVSACEQSPLTAGRTLGAPASALRQSFTQSSSSPFENATFAAHVTIDVTDLGAADDGKPHHWSDTLTAAGLVRHGSGFLTLPPTSAGTAVMTKGGRMLVLETDAGRAHGPRKAPRSGLNSAGQRVGLEGDDAQDGGPIKAMRGYLDDKLVYASTSEWMRREGRWELRKTDITIYRAGIPVRRTTLRVDMDETHSLVASLNWAAQFGDAARWAGNASLAALEPSPLYAQESTTQPVVNDGSPDALSWWDHVTAFLSAVLAAGAAWIEGATAAFVAALFAALTTGIAVFYMYSQALGPACGDYIALITTDDSQDDIMMDAMCFGPGGPFYIPTIP